MYSLNICKLLLCVRHLLGAGCTKSYRTEPKFKKETVSLWETMGKQIHVTDILADVKELLQDIERIQRKKWVGVT